MQKLIENLKHIFLLFIGILLLPNEVMSQRVFAPSEEGFLVELKEGGKPGKGFLTIKPSYPKKMVNIVTEPFKLYIFSEDEIGPDEVYISQIYNGGNGDEFMRAGARKKVQTNFMKGALKKIFPNIYEISSEKDPFSMDNQAATPKFVLGFDPNKKHQKEGKEKKFWYANISQLNYEEVNEWPVEQAIESINQLVETGKTTEQLFASINPQQSQIVNGQQIQYVVVQNQNTPVISENQQKQDNQKEEIISDVDKNIPYRDIINDNTFALIIANEDYNKVAPVNFALRDGQKINEYLKKTLGIDKDHIAFLENATLNDMRYEVNRLTKISDAYNGEASFIIYYIGHGIPDEKNGNGYLLPVDGYGNDVTTAYPLEELYSQLSGLDAKKIVLFTDACFSGANKSGDMLVAARGIAIRSNPNEAKGHLIAFSACQGDETAYSYDEQGHGLFTYYFLKKLKDTGGQTTLGELEEYIVDNVGKTAIVINGKSQTPKVSVSPELQETWRDQTFFE